MQRRVRAAPPPLSPLLLVGLAVAALALVAVLWIRPFDWRRLDADLRAAVEAGRAVVEELALPPGATALGSVETTAVLHRGARASATRLVEAPGAFRDSASLHRGLLITEGWLEVAGRDPDLAAAFCRPPFLIELEERMRLAGREPRHRYAIRLHWAPGITAAHCRRLSR